MSDLFTKPSGGGNGAKSEPEAVYSYTDEAGTLLFEVVRFPSKRFRPRRPDGRGGWSWNLNGVRRVLYHLPEVIKAECVLVCEGERDCDTAKALGLVATTNPHGAGKWREEHTAFLKGKRVTIIADADVPGLAHARDVACSVVSVAASVRVIEALPQAKDLTDWVALGEGDFEGAREQLCAMIQAARTLTPIDVAKWQRAKGNGFILTPLGELLSRPSTPVDYVWEGRLASGTVSGLVGKPKVGKGTLARNLCLCVAHGEEFLGLPTKRGECIYLALEEREEDVRTDFAAMGADGSEPIFVHAASAPAQGITALCGLIRERRPVLVVIDPLFRLARIKDEKAYAETYEALGPLIDAARETETHLMLLHHSGKSLRSDPIDSPLGSTAIGGAVSTLIVQKRTEAYRTIQTVQRIGQDMPETVLAFDATTRRVSTEGTRLEAERNECEAGILEFLRDSGGLQTQAQIRAGVRGQTQVIRAALTELAKAGRVVRTGAGSKGNPFLYGFEDSGSQYTVGTSKPESQK